MQKRLSDRVADDILNMITVDKKFLPGEKLPNEIDLSEELKISRATLREAVRILAAGGVVEIRRGLGTFVREDFKVDDKKGILSLANLKTDIRDLYEMRLIVEPEESRLRVTLRRAETGRRRREIFTRQSQRRATMNL